MGALLGIGQALLTGLGNASDRSQVQNQFADEESAAKRQIATGTDSFKKMLDGLGPEYEPIRQAMKNGMSVHEASSIIGGPVGANLRETARQDSLRKMFPNNDDFKDPAKVTQAIGMGILHPDEANAIGKMLTGPKLDAFQDFLRDVKGITPDRMSEVPRPVMDKYWQEFKTKAGEGAGAGDSEYASNAADFQQYLAQHPEVKGLKYTDQVKMFHSETKQATSDRDALTQANVAMTGLDKLLDAAKPVLPEDTGPGALFSELGRGTYLAPTIHSKEQYANIARFNAAKTVLINHLRAVAKAARVNQTELNMASETIDKAATYSALDSAVQEAKARLGEIQYDINSRTIGTTFNRGPAPDARPPRNATPSAPPMTTPPKPTPGMARPYKRADGTKGTAIYVP